MRPASHYDIHEWTHMVLLLSYLSVKLLDRRFGADIALYTVCDASTRFKISNGKLVALSIITYGTTLPLAPTISLTSFEVFSRTSDLLPVM
jgi:hypothetical protein